MTLPKKQVETKGVTSYLKEESLNEVKKALTPEQLESATVVEIKQNVLYLIKSVSTRESSYVFRVLRSISALRKKLNPNILKQSILGFLPNNPTLKTILDKYFSTAALSDPNIALPTVPANSIPEVETFIHLLVVIYLLDQKRFTDSLDCSQSLIQHLQNYNRRTLDPLLARSYFYYSLCFERVGKLHEIRETLHVALRNATLHKDYSCQASLLNLLLRNYLHYNLIEQADKLFSKSSFPTNSSNNDLARHMYYLGYIKAIQLDYTESHSFIVQAIRKAPESSAPGFAQAVQKLHVVIQLLLGEIPDRSLFRIPSLKRSLYPYFQLTQSVRTGNLAKFSQLLESSKDKFVRDGMYTLILRLRHNVIKTGIRMINLSYSNISLKDICAKLHLDSPENAEYIVAKAIRDGVISAVIDHTKACVQSKELVDVYASNEPQKAFNQRISFCLKTYNESVMALRFPANAFRNQLETAEQRREREQLEKDLADEMAEADGADDDF
eukprot:Sdes_comp23336_c0_seq1m21602